jgi:hypothetical protein
MKRFRVKILFLALSMGFFSANASPGDTTWVQAQNDVQLNYYNKFDALVTFPGGTTTYRKIIMVFTLGKYQCPAGTQYCGDWDYTVQNYLMTATDTLELSRLITPYADEAQPRTPWGWQQHYYFDVTDFYPYMKGPAAIRLFYSGYSGGFTGNIRFAFIEGTPPRNVTGITKLWEGSFNYGDVNSIEAKVGSVNVTAPAGTQSAEMKFTVTGHGADNNNCSEFCSKYYQVKQNGNMLQQVNIWKNDCGYNNLFPQSGTWIYNRANWCPGEQVRASTFPFASVTAGTNYSADVDFQAYSKVGSGTPSYTVSGYMVHYGGYNQTLDASVEEIISPSDYEGNFRSNPMFGSPVIRIRNTGGTAITSVSFQFGVVGQTMQTFTLTGMNLLPSGEATVALPKLTALTSLPAGSTNQFTVSIQQLNGVNDPYAINNTMRSNFVSAPLWPSQFNMVFKTNNFGTQTRWRIEDLNGNLVAERNPTTGQTTFNDPVSITTNGAYKLIVTDDNCDGLYWWANYQQTGSGWIYTQTADGAATIPYTNGLPALPSGSSQDFGCGFTQYFRVNSNVTTAIPVVVKKYEVSVNPNPFSGRMVLTIGTMKPEKAVVKLFDMRGSLVVSKNIQVQPGINSIELNDLQKLVSGMYLVEVKGEQINFSSKIIKQ